ncbi:MAG: RnfABCDGE type electron transport complex subunit D [Luminiphilus sp.]|nr:RnfABCDGE type electron transport complex subunit D [Luminiphilus sp.]
MSLLHVSSPHIHKPFSSVEQVMKQVLLATIPGVLVMTWFFGPGTLLNIILGSALALGFEAWALWLRGKDFKSPLKDHSVIVTATLLCIALPPYAPWWLIAVGIGVSVLLGKQVFGGLGYNPFNPAMVGYVVLLISFPLQMSSWTEPRGVGDVPGMTDAFVALFAASSYDGVSAATPLDLFRQNSGMLFDGLMTSKAEMAGVIAGRGWDMVNLAFLAGGLWLLRQRIFTWHAPAGMLAALSVCALIGFDEGSSTGGGSILFHLFSGATMFGAFFIITDPVSSAVSNKGRLIFGALVGVLVYLIRVYGNYPDALAFGVLLMNFAAPLIDQHTQPAVYGTKKIEVDE